MCFEICVHLVNLNSQDVGQYHYSRKFPLASSQSILPLTFSNPQGKLLSWCFLYHKLVSTFLKLQINEKVLYRTKGTIFYNVLPFSSKFTHFACLSLKTNMGPLNISPLTVGTKSSFIRVRKRHSRRKKGFFLPSSSVLKQAPEASTASPVSSSCLTGSLSGIRFLQCLRLPQFQLLQCTAASPRASPTPAWAVLQQGASNETSPC